MTNIYKISKTLKQEADHVFIETFHCLLNSHFSSSCRRIGTAGTITQMELARLLGISQTHLSNIEKGRVQISLRLLVKMANIFNCRLDDFFGMSECLSEPEYESSFSEEDMALIMKLLQMMRKRNNCC